MLLGVCFSSGGTFMSWVLPGGVRMGRTQVFRGCVFFLESKAHSLPRYHVVINTWNGKRVELLIKSLSLISEDRPSFRV